MKEGVEESYNTLIKDLTFHDGMVNHLEIIFKKYRTYFIEKDPTIFGKEGFLMGSTIGFYNPYTSQLTTGFQYEVTLGNLERQIAEIERNIYNQIGAQAYESLEKYLKDVCSYLVVTSPELAASKLPELGFSVFSSCRRFLKKWDTPKIYNAIQTICPELQARITRNPNFSEYAEWLAVFDFCRHCIIHSQGRFQNLQKINNKKKFYERFGIDEENMVIDFHNVIKAVIDWTATISLLIKEPILIYFDSMNKTENF